MSGYNDTPYTHNNAKVVDKDEVVEYTLEDFGLTPDNIKLNHFGVDIRDPRTKEHLPDAFYQSKIEAAVASVEKKLDIAILPRIETEHHDFYRNDFESHMYIHAWKKPILQVERVRMEYGGTSIYEYPQRWWKVYNLPGHIQMLPSLLLSGGNQGLNVSQMYTGYPVSYGMSHITQGSNHAPQLFHIEYVAGMLPPSRQGVTKDYEMHPDLWQLIIKMALKEVLQQWGRLIIGPGVANMSMSIDGVSQSIDTTQSAMHGGASADILQLDRDIAELTSGLKSYYGVNLGLI